MCGDEGKAERGKGKGEREKGKGKRQERGEITGNVEWKHDVGSEEWSKATSSTRCIVVTLCFSLYHPCCLPGMNKCVLHRTWEEKKFRGK